MTIIKQTGTKYAATSDLNTTQIAALVRADIKAAVKSGALPKASYSVRTSRYSMGSSITVGVSGLGFATRTTREYVVPAINSWSHDARTLRSNVDAILASYNDAEWDSEPTDYSRTRFHADVNVESTYDDADPVLVARSQEVAAKMWPAPKCVAATGWDDAAEIS